MASKFTILCAALLVLATAVSSESFNIKKIPISSDNSVDWLYVSKTGKTAAVATSSSSSASLTFDLTTGKQLAKLQAPAPSGSNSQGFIVLNDNTAYISTSCGVQAFSVRSGNSLWCKNVVVSGGGVGLSNKLDLIFVVPRGGGSIVALNATSGATAYTVTGDMQEKQPFVTFGESILLLPGASGSLSGYDAKTGKKLWMLPNINAWNTDSSLQAFTDQFNDNMVVMLGNYGATIMKIDAKAGKLVWSQPLVKPSYGSNVDDVVAVYSGFSYFCYNGSSVAQISQDDGTPKHQTSSNSTSVNGLLNIQDQWILSLDGSTTVNYFDELDGSYGGSFELPEAAIGGQGTVNQDSAVVLTNSYVLVITQ